MVQAIGKVCGIKIVGTRARYFFLEAAREISEKQNFFVNCSVPENFQPEIFSGHVPTESLPTQNSENAYERWVQQILDPVLVARSWVSATKMGSVSKIMSRSKKLIRPQFSKYRLQIESALGHRLWPHAVSFWKRYFENCGRAYFF